MKFYFYLIKYFLSLIIEFTYLIIIKERKKSFIYNNIGLKICYFIIIFFFTNIVFLKKCTFAQENNSAFDNKIITIEAPHLIEDTNSQKDSVINRPIGTAFILGMSSYFKNKRFLVTAKHVIDEIINTYDSDLILRIPYKDSVNKSIRFSCDLNSLSPQDILYPKDSCYDLVVIEFSNLSGVLLENTSINMENLDYGAFPISTLKNSSDTLQIGNFILLAGYPRGLSGTFRNYLIYRFGIISTLITDKFEDLCNRHFLINTESSGGDSGSPVFSMSGFFNSTEKIIGVLSGSYFTGLSVVEPIEVVKEMIDEYLSKIK